MARGNGKHAQQAIQSGKLSAFIKTKGDTNGYAGFKDFVDWAEVDHTLLLDALYSLVKVGGALLFGCSRDKTSYSVKIYVGGEGTPYYFPCNAQGVEDLHRLLMGVAEAAKADFDVLI